MTYPSDDEHDEDIDESHFIYEPLDLETEEIHTATDFAVFHSNFLENLQHDAERIAIYLRLESVNLDTPFNMVQVPNAIPDGEFIRFLHFSFGIKPIDLEDYFVGSTPNYEKNCLVVYFIPKLLLVLSYEPLGMQPFFYALGFEVAMPNWAKNE